MSENIESDCLKILRGIKQNYSNQSNNNFMSFQRDLLNYSLGKQFLNADQLSSYLKDRKGNITDEQILFILQQFPKDENNNYQISSIQSVFNQISSKYPSLNPINVANVQNSNSPGKLFPNAQLNNQQLQNNLSQQNDKQNNQQNQDKVFNDIILINEESDDEEENKANERDQNKQNLIGKKDKVIFNENEKMISEDSFESLNQKLGFLKEQHIKKAINLNDIKNIFPSKKISFQELVFFLGSYGIELSAQEQQFLKESLISDDNSQYVYIKDFLEFMNLKDNYYNQIEKQQNSQKNKVLPFPPPPNLYYQNQNINGNIQIINFPMIINNKINHNNHQQNNKNNQRIFQNNQNINTNFYYPPSIPFYQQNQIIPNNQVPQFHQNVNIQNNNNNKIIEDKKNIKNNNNMNNNNIKDQVQVVNNNWQQNNLQINQIQNNNQQNYMLNSQCEDYFEILDEQIEGIEEFYTKFYDCQINDKEFIDSSFPPSQDSIVKDQSSKRYYEWRNLGWYRPVGFFNGQPYSMFEKFKSVSQSRVGLGKLISPNDIQQGMLGDCYFLSALSCLAQEPHRILNLFITRKTNKYGIYCVKICHDGAWKAVYVDDHIPCIHKKPAFTKANGNELWVLLIEKAWAKLFNSYAKIESGYCHEAMRDLTGAPTANFLTYEDVQVNGNTIQQMNQSLLPILMDALSEQNRFLITAANDNSDLSKSQADRLGLVTSHAYSLIGFKEINHHILGKVMLVRLRNPWGKKEWKGDWSDESQLWTPELREKLRVTKKQDGIFYMSLEDFYKYFNQITICYYHDFFKYSSIKVLESDGKHSQYFTLQVKTKGTYYISIVQPSKRNFDKDIYYETGISRIFVMQLLDQEGASNIKYIGSQQKKSREIFIECNLEPGSYLIQAKVKWELPTFTSYVVSSYGIDTTEIQPTQKKQIPNQFLEECFKTHARKNSNLKLKGQVMFCKHIDHKQGYGYFYIQNISNSTYSIDMHFQQYTGLKFKKPQRVPNISLVAVPQTEIIALFTVSCFGYQMQYQEYYKQN
ncbi:calpain family cysteine protease (macronuclear) [Tetrahymena thermophila SB210]|uniref:Calpain family cysteine protease n=1 Tax=Tetrahymena thermophila (strain SB210) TaxID=312017 RepID=I7MFB0_TETTS|nr:calpain family cysteine protease [Tetrahymena thermophila SB210]EAR83765.2 calpain family cysteine protease [Tetrahymena thermophila SB210]|eukprot:XP_001031428.2 calpain family cysteine protease [Tetrahymena thermophila SB210]